MTDSEKTLQVFSSNRRRNVKTQLASIFQTDNSDNTLPMEKRPICFCCYAHTARGCYYRQVTQTVVLTVTAPSHDGRGHSAVPGDRCGWHSFSLFPDSLFSFSRLRRSRNLSRVVTSNVPAVFRQETLPLVAHQSESGGNRDIYSSVFLQRFSTSRLSRVLIVFVVTRRLLCFFILSQTLTLADRHYYRPSLISNLIFFTNMSSRQAWP